MIESNSTTTSFDWRAAARYGLLGGIVSVYFSAIGMVASFSVRNLIGTFLNLGTVLALAGAIAGGLLAVRKKQFANKNQVLLSGLIAGAAAGIPPIIMLLLSQIFDVHNMFINLSEQLMNLLTFGQGPGLGYLLLLLAFIVLGFAGAGFTLLSKQHRAALTNSLIWIFALGLFSENASTILERFFGRSFVHWLFQSKSLNPIAAIGLFIITYLFTYLRFSDKAKGRWQSMPVPAQKRGRIVLIILGFLLLLGLPWIVGRFLSQVLFLIGLYVMMGLGLNIVVGYAGLLDLGYVAFFAFGAYTMGVLNTSGILQAGHFNFWTALPFGVVVAVFFGVLLGFPVLNMRGDYLAIVTLGFGEIIRVLAYSNWLAPIIGGAQGVLHIGKPTIGSLVFTTPESMYYLVLVGSLLAMFITVRLRDSRLGRQWMAMREDEDVAEAMGINLVQTKLLAFAIGAGFSGLSGAIFASRLGNIFPNSFGILVSINVLSLIIVGGLGSIPGVVVGSAILVGMPELLREFAEYRLLMYGILLIVMMLVKPEGFWPEETRKRELHAGENNDLEDIEVNALPQAEAPAE